MKPTVIRLAKYLDDRGNLSFLENNKQIPFIIKRVHWIFDVPGGESRGSVAYLHTDEFIIAMSGSFDVVVDDGSSRTVTPLNRSYMGVFVPKGYWRSIENFSTNSVAVIAASTHYNVNDAIHDYDKFLTDSIQIDNKYIQEEKNNIEICTEFEKHSVYDCGIITLDRHHSERKGDICVVENGETVPFDVKRLYYLYDVPGGVSRGGHAHKNLYQLIVAASGSFYVTLDDGNVKRTFFLNRPYQGLFVKPGIWRELDDFSSGSVCLVLASELYDESDYIRDYSDFLRFRSVR